MAEEIRLICVHLPIIKLFFRQFYFFHYLVEFGVGHVFGFHSAVLRRLAGELHEEQQLFKDGWVHDLQVLRADTDGLQQGGNRGTNTADIHTGLHIV